MYNENATKTKLNIKKFIFCPICEQTSDLQCSECGKKFIINNLFDNQNRKQIFELVKKNKDISITDISKTINLSYKNTFFHVKKLEEYGLITKDKQEKSQGRVVYVKWTGKNIEDEFFYCHEDGNHFHLSEKHCLRSK